MNPKTQEATMSGIGTRRRQAREKILAGALNPIRGFITDALIHDSCRTVKHSWNQCVWDPVLTLLACVWKQLHATASVRQVEDWVASLDSTAFSGSNDGADFCAARKRLPAGILRDIMRQVGAVCSARAGFFFNGLPVWIVDGTTLRTPNSPQNDAGFGRSSNQTRSSRSPILRLVILVCAGCGAVLSAAAGPYVWSEGELFLRVLREMPGGGLLIADRAYASFLTFVLVLRRGSHVLTRHNSLRRRNCIQRLGRGDEIHQWRRPGPKQVARPDLLDDCPETIKVRVITKQIERRGYRTWKLKIATTLLDPVAYPADQLAELYLRRWNIELDLRILKSEYGMARLSGRTPDVICKEIYSTMLAYNAVLAVMSESGETVRHLSHTRARKLLLNFADQMAGMLTASLPDAFRRLLALIARAKLQHQERPPEPRAIIQRPSTYPTLMTSRKAWRRAHHAA
jgi:hypothetical protein